MAGGGAPGLGVPRIRDSLEALVALHKGASGLLPGSVKMLFLPTDGRAGRPSAGVWEVREPERARQGRGLKHTGNMQGLLEKAWCFGTL